MPHDGNRSSSKEEVEAVAQLVGQLTGAKWMDQDGTTCPLTAARALRHVRRRKPGVAGTSMPDTQANATGERPLPVRRNGKTALVVSDSAR